MLVTIAIKGRQGGGRKRKYGERIEETVYQGEGESERREVITIQRERGRERASRRGKRGQETERTIREDVHI